MMGSIAVLSVTKCLVPHQPLFDTTGRILVSVYFIYLMEVVSHVKNFFMQWYILSPPPPPTLVLVLSYYNQSSSVVLNKFVRY